MRELTIIGREIDSVDDLHDLMARELEFPDYYGANLDALYDVLTESSEETYIELNLEGMEEGAMKTYLERVWRVMCDAAEENFSLDITRIEDIEDADDLDENSDEEFEE